MPEPTENHRHVVEIKVQNDEDKEGEKQENGETESQAKTEPEKAEKLYDAMRDEPVLTELIVESYEGEKDERGFFHGSGTACFSGGHMYTGYFFNGLMHGNGKYIWANGIIYEGEFTESKIEGKGKYTWTDDSTYEGEVANGLRHGHGVFSCSAIPSTYTGEWRNGKRHGTGVLRYDSKGQSYYEGHWVNNKRHGYGIRQFPSGNVYEGDWKDNLRHGSGIMQWYDRNERYNGQWEYGVQHGNGEHSWYLKRIVGSQYPLRNCYVGEWVNGLRHGHGVFYYANGAKYSGEWINNMKHGKGKYTFKNGMVFEGAFEQDHMLDYPDFTPSRMTTPDITASGIPVRSATPVVRSGTPHLPSEDSSNGSKNSLNINISHLQHDRELRPNEREEETQQVVHVLLRHISNLKNIYSFYSGLGHLGTADNTFVMTRLQFWRFLKDCRIHDQDVTLIEMDRFIDANKQLLEIHDPQQDVLMRDFLNAIVTISYHVFKDQHSGCMPVLPWCVSKFICENILPDSCDVKGSLFADPARAVEALKYLPKSLDIFQLWCSLNHAPPHEPTFKARQFLFMLTDYRLLNDNLSSKEVLRILASDDPHLAGDDFCNMELEMTFLDFFEALIECAAVFVTEAVMKDPGTPKASSETSSRSQSARSFTPVTSKPGDDTPDEGDQDQGTLSVVDTPSRERSPDRGSRGGAGEASEHKKLSIAAHSRPDSPNRTREQDKSPESGAPMSQDGGKRTSSVHSTQKPSVQSLPPTAPPGNDENLGGSHLSATVHRVGGGEEEASAEIGGQSPPQEQDPFQYWAAQLSIFFERKFFEAADRLETLKKSGKNKHFPL